MIHSNKIKKNCVFPLAPLLYSEDVGIGEIQIKREPSAKRQITTIIFEKLIRIQNKYYNKLK